jgi:serpin B
MGGVYMKSVVKVCVVLTVSIFLLLGALAIPAFPQEKAKSGSGPYDIVGKITRINKWKRGGEEKVSISVEGKKTAKTNYDKAWIEITSRTGIFGQDDKAAKAEDLQEGFKVAVKFDGPVRESYPVQATAKEIIIREDLELLARIKSVAGSNNKFACDLYAKLKDKAEKKDGNLFFSPASISTALAMTYAGARGQTAAEMKTVLHFALEDKKLHPAMGALAKSLSAKKEGLKLSIANALWGQKGYGFLKEFLDLNKKNYEAGLSELDFITATEEARKTINDWVEKKTNNKIKDLLKPGSVPKDTRLILTNAIYFKGTWMYQFKKKDTKKENFHLSEQKNARVYMMHMKKKTLKYMKGDGFAALALPYEGNDVSMVIFLSDKVDGLADLEKELTGENIEKWISQMRKKKIAEVAIPRFKMTKDFVLGKMLQEMGMPTAFRWPGADFSGMTGSRDLFIGEVIHKAFVDVNEEGTEAAAATAVVMRTGAVAARPTVFKADHPFAFIIRDNKSGAVLFMGRIANPAAGK